jgi:deazaflavin-dependent oxidoreductase (nitroreductase family)
VESATDQEPPWPARWASEPYAYLTTTGRRTGRPHRIEIWFGVDAGRVYLLSGGRDRADWVRNLQVHPRVSIEIGPEARTGSARILQSGEADDDRARELLVGKYRDGSNLDEWGRTSLAIVIEFADTGETGRIDERDHSRHAR